MRAERRLDRKVFQIAAGEHHAHVVDALVVYDGGCIARWHRLTGAQCALRDSGTVAAGKDPKQSDRRPARRGGELVLENLDDPVAAADWNAGEAGGIFGLEPPLGGGDTSRVGRQNRHHDANRRAQRGGSSGANKPFRQNEHGATVPFDDRGWGLTVRPRGREPFPPRASDKCRKMRRFCGFVPFRPTKLLATPAKPRA